MRFDSGCNKVDSQPARYRGTDYPTLVPREKPPMASKRALSAILSDVLEAGDAAALEGLYVPCTVGSGRWTVCSVVDLGLLNGLSCGVGFFSFSPLFRLVGGSLGYLATGLHTPCPPPLPPFFTPPVF